MLAWVYSLFDRKNGGIKVVFGRRFVLLVVVVVILLKGNKRCRI